MKIIRILFLISSLAILVVPSSSVKQDDEIIVKALHRKLMIVLDEHENVMTSTHYEGSSSQEVGVTSSSGKLNYEKEEKLKREEDKNLSKYLAMDYLNFRRRRPVHNKSLPRSLTP